MIDPVSIGLLLAGAAIGVALLAFWQEIKDWFIRIWHKLPLEVRDNLKGVLAFAKMLDNSVVSIMKYYSYNAVINQWNETIVSKQITSDEIPEHIKIRIKNNEEVDITDDLSRELKLSL